MFSVYTKPKEDELLSSWLIRLSFLNGNDLSGFITPIFREYRFLTRDIDRSISFDKLEKLSKIIDININNLQNLTLEPTIEFITNKKSSPYKAWSWVIPLGIRNRTVTNGLQFCSKCLKEDAYYKKRWRLSWNVACEKHKIQLESTCPKCNNSFSPHLTSYNNPNITICSYCQFDLKKIITKSISLEALELQNYLNQILQLKSVIKSQYNLLDSNVIEVFNTIEILMNFFMLLRRNKETLQIFKQELLINEDLILNNNSNLSKYSLSVNDRTILLNHVSLFLKYPTKKLINLLQKNNITQKKLSYYKNDSNNISPTIKYLIENLKSFEKNSFKKNITKKPIIPRTREEVLIILEKIDKYL